MKRLVVDVCGADVSAVLRSRPRLVDVSEEPSVAVGDCRWVDRGGECEAELEVRLFGRWEASDLVGAAQALSDAKFWLEGFSLREVERAWRQSPDAASLVSALRGDAPPAPIPAQIRGYDLHPLIRALGAAGAEHIILAVVTGWARANRARWIPADGISRGMIQWKRRWQ